MEQTLESKFSLRRIWFGFLIIYIMSTYLAQDVLLPSMVNSIILYAFLGFSAVTILCYNRIYLSSVITWELICLGLAFIAMLYSPSFSIFGGTYYAMIVNFVVIFILTQMPWNETRFHMILKTFVISSVLLIIALIVTGNMKDESGRLGTELVGNANTLACMLMVSAIYSIYLYICSTSNFSKVLYLISVIVIYYGMFLSGGRKYVIIPIVFMYIMLLNKTDKSGRKHIFKYTAVIIFVVFLLYKLVMEVPFFYESIGYRFEGFFALFDDSYTVDGSTLKRKLMAEAAIKRWLDSPIWGYGFDSFKYYNASSVTGDMYYAHNNFVELLHNQGIIGFFGYYGFYIFLFKEILKNKVNSHHRGFVMGVIASLLIFEYYGVTYSITPVQILLFFCYYCLQSNETTMDALEDDEVNKMQV